MDKNEHPERAVLIYFVALIMFVISKMVNKATLIDVIYLITLVSAVFKYFLIVRESRK